MTAGAIATTASAIVLLGIAIAHYSFGRRGSRVGRVALRRSPRSASLALPLAARGRAVAPRAAVAPMPHVADGAAAAACAGPRVFMLLLDGASLDYILPRVAEGRLPAFARLLDRGAVMDLATIRPTQPDPVWAAVGDRHVSRPRTACGRPASYLRARRRPRRRPASRSLLLARARAPRLRARSSRTLSTIWRARPLWSIISERRLPVGVVRWPLTYPAEPVNGFIVSDRFHQLVGSIAEFDRASPTRSPAGTAGGLRRRDPDVAAAAGAAVSGAAGSIGDASRSRVRRRLARTEHVDGPAFRGAPLRRARRGRPLLPQRHPAAHVRATYPMTSAGGSLQIIDAYYAFIDGEVDAADRRACVRTICSSSWRGSGCSRSTKSSA